MTGPLALVYRGPAARPTACSHAVAALLRSSGRRFDVRFVGPRDRLKLSPAALADAVLYAQPGGGELEPAYRRLRQHRDTIRDYVAAGGRYLGFCLGGYLAGRTPGFGLLPGDTDRYAGSPGAVVAGTGDVVVTVEWRARRRTLFFQDGPVFLLDPDAARRGAVVLARYPDGAVAALAASFGSGRVGVVGPHPEAGPDWFADAGLPAFATADLGHDLIDEVLR